MLWNAGRELQGGKGLLYPNNTQMSLGNRKKHWTHQQGIAHKLTGKYDRKPNTHFVVFDGNAPGIYRSYPVAMSKAAESRIWGYPSEAEALEAFTKHFMRKAKPRTK